MAKILLAVARWITDKLADSLRPTPAWAMPLPPARPPGTGDMERAEVPLAAVGTANASLTTQGPISDRVAYLTAARYNPNGAAAASGTNFRTWSVVANLTRAITDGCIVDPANALGPWNVATVYTAGKWVVLNNLMYVCTVGVTGGTGPGLDTGHWQQIAAAGLNFVNTLSTAFDADDLGRAISDAGNTNIPASTRLGFAPITGQAQSATAPITQPVAGAGQAIVVSGIATALPLCDASGAQVAGTAVVGRTVTVGSVRTLASFATTAVSLAANVEQDLVLSGTDTKIYQGEVITVTSVFTAAGVADPGGMMQLEMTAFGEGTD
jgi:hypothetical protein